MISSKLNKLFKNDKSSVHQIKTVINSETQKHKARHT